MFCTSGSIPWFAFGVFAVVLVLLSAVAKGPLRRASNGKASGSAGRIFTAF